MHDLPIIAVIDPDPHQQRMLATLIVDSCYQYRGYLSAEQLLETGLDDIPDCLVLESQLPGISGIDLQQRLRHRAIHIPRIFLSSAAAIGLRRRAIRGGASAFLPKPAARDQLLEQIDGALWGRPSAHSLFRFPCPQAAQIPVHSCSHSDWRQ